MTSGVNADASRLAVPVRAAANLKRSVLVAIPFAVVALVLLVMVGHSLAGALVFVGVALAATNNWLVQRSVVRFGESESADKKKKFILGSISRLAVVTLVAGVVLLLARVDGLGVLAGLALFQLIMLGGAVVPMVKELRNS